MIARVQMNRKCPPRLAAWKSIALLATASLLLSGCGGSTALSPCELRWANQVDAPTLDPHGSTNGFVLGLLANVYEPLVGLNDELKPEPALATRWEMVSPVRWRFHLRRNVRFHDGSAFDADDVIFSLNRIGDPQSIIRDRVGMVSRLVRVDAHTVDVVTTRPNPILPMLWSKLFIIDKQWAEKHGATHPSSATSGRESYASRQTNGTGAYRIVDREQDVRTLFRRFDGWWNKAAAGAPERVVFKPIGNSGTRIATLLSGDADLISPLSIQDINRVRGRADLDLLIRPEMRVIFLGFDQFRDQGIGANVRGNPFRDARVRRAVSLAIDRGAVRDKLMYGLSKPASTLIAPELFPAATALPAPRYDPAEAKRLLRAAGYADGFTTKLVCTNDRYVNDGLLCQAIVSMLARIGIHANLQAIPVNQYARAIGRPAQDFGIYLQGWTPAGLDSFNILFNIMSSFDPKTGRGNTNYGAFSDPRIDALTAQVESELDPARRDRLIAQAYRIMTEKAYYVPLHTQPVIWAANKRFAIAQRGDDTFFFANVRANGYDGRAACGRPPTDR
jgi:peptide/nickel transport system substrate-binding protein